MARPLMSRENIPGASSTSARIAIVPAAILAGVMAALAFFIWQILVNELVFRAPTWSTTRLVASIVLGEDVARRPLMWDAVVVATAAAVHLALAIIYALIAAPLLHRLARLRAIAAGIGLGGVLYAINFYIFVPTAFPWMAEMRNAVTLIGHLIFGCVVAYTYKLSQTAQQKTIDRPEADEQSRRP